MSILNTNEQASPQQRTAFRILNGTKTTCRTLVAGWEGGFDALWHNPQVTPADALLALGDRAAEVFALSAATVTFLGTILPGRLDDDWARIQAKVAALPATTAHPDGTVTIDS